MIQSLWVLLLVTHAIDVNDVRVAERASAGNDAPCDRLILEPSETPEPGELVFARCEYRNQLYVEPFCTVTRSGNTVRVVLYLSDVVEPGPVSQRFEIGRFPPGTYRLEFGVVPVLLPPGADDTPTIFDVRSLVVAPRPVPVGGSSSAIALWVLLTMAAVRLRLREAEFRA